MVALTTRPPLRRSLPRGSEQIGAVSAEICLRCAPMNDQDDDSTPEHDEAEAASRSGAAKAKRRAARRDERQKPSEEPKGLPPRVMLALVATLAVGGAAGWFGHEAQAKARLRAESAPAAAGSASANGPC